MKDPIDDALNGLFGKRSSYSPEEIKKAQEKKRRDGGTLLDALQEMTGRSLIMPSAASVSDRAPEQAKKSEPPCRENDRQAETAAKEARSAASSVSAFDGLAEEAAKTVFGQDKALRSLLLAFKRPFLLPPEKGFPRNTVFLTGRENTGRHLMLRETVRLLANRGILQSGAVHTLDLSLYGTSESEKLFLQDLYAALSSEAEVILFENCEQCHPAFLSRLSELVLTGKCPLHDRYIMQNGQLASTGNVLAVSSVAALTAEKKYLVFCSSKGRSQLADTFGVPFVNALGDTVETAVLDREALSLIAAAKEQTLTAAARERLSFILTVSPDFRALALARAEDGGAAPLLQFYDDTLRALAEAKLTGSCADAQAVTLYVRQQKPCADFGAGELDLFSLLPTAYSGDTESIRKELDAVVGLREVKEYVLGLEEYYRMQQRRRAEGLPADELSRHMIFTGNPGTGKTTIARIISRYLKALGILGGGQLVEVSRADLVGRYVGHTAPLTNQVIVSALGGVLFIDEAYSLYRGKDDSFGLEAIDTLVKGMEDHRNELIVILAGYEKEMAEFLTANSGLKSRFPNIIAFPDYTGEELLSIAKSIAKGKGYRISEDCEAPLLAYFNTVQAVRAAEAGNGRLARNKVEEAILRQSRRLAAKPESDLSLLTEADFDLSDV